MSLWKTDAGISIGVSDSGLALQLGRILSVVKPRTLMIRRPVGEVVASMKAYMPDPSLDHARATRFLEECAEALEKRAMHHLVKKVEFRYLDDPEAMSDALDWLLPGYELPDVRFLAKMNIQVRADHVRDLLSKSHTGWHLNP